jgi:hypothetical protein
MADGRMQTEALTGALPHNVEAEQALLGALLVNNDVFDRVAAIVQPEHFYEPVHARIFEVAANRIQKNALASPVTLKAFFEEDEGLRELGGPAYLARLAGAAISLFAARDYAQLVYDLAIRRDLIQIGHEIAEKAARTEVDSEPRDQIVEAEQALYQLGEQGKVDKGFQSFLRPRRTRSRWRTPPIAGTGGWRDSPPGSSTSTSGSGACIRRTCLSSRGGRRWARPRWRPTSPSTSPKATSAACGRTGPRARWRGASSASSAWRCRPSSWRRACCRKPRACPPTASGAAT